MIGNLDFQHKEVSIIGGGIAGLLAAHYLDRACFRVELFEKGARVGGLIQTKITPFGIVESAAHSILATPSVRALCNELGVELVSVNKNSRARYIWRQGKMRRFPLGLIETLELGVRAAFVPKRAENLSLEQWGRRHLGPAAVEYLMSPLTRGIFGAEPNEIDAKLAFPGLSLRQRKPKGQMVSPSVGMEALVQALEDSLRKRLGSRFHTNTEIKELPIRRKNIVLSMPAYAAADLLEKEASELSHALRQVQYVPLVCATLFFKSADFKKPPRGVGVLFPKIESRKILGVLFNSSAFINRVQSNDHVSLTLMAGGTSSPKMITMKDQELIDIFLKELREVCSLKTQQPLFTQIIRCPRAIPLYSNDLKHTLALAKETWCSSRGRILFGNYTGQVSIRAMIDELSQKFKTLFQGS